MKIKLDLHQASLKIARKNYQLEEIKELEKEENRNAEGKDSPFQKDTNKHKKAQH